MADWLSETWQDLALGFFRPPTYFVTSVEHAEAILVGVRDLTSVRIYGTPEVGEYLGRRVRELEAEDAEIATGDREALLRVAPRLLQGWRWYARCVLCGHPESAHRAGEVACSCCDRLGRDRSAIPVTIERRQSIADRLTR